MSFIKKIGVYMIITAMLTPLLLSGCAREKSFAETSGNEEVKKIFSGYRFPGDIVDRLGIEYDHKPDTKGLEKVTGETEEDDSYSVNYLNKKGKTVYTFYENSPEPRFDFYTKDKDGNDITATYYLDGEDGITGVKATGNDYDISIYYDENGKRECYSNQYDPDDKMIFVACNEKDSEWQIESAGWFDDEGYVSYSGWYDIDNKWQDWFEHRYEKEEKIETTDVSEFYGEIPFIFRAGKHTLSYTQENGKREWYMTFGIIVQFDNMESAEDFAAKYKTAKPHYSDIDGETPEIIIEDVTLKFSEKFEDFAEFAKREFNDDYSLVINLDENYEITAFGIGGVQFY